MIQLILLFLTSFSLTSSTQHNHELLVQCPHDVNYEQNEGIPLNHKFTMFGETLNTAFISNNGFVSFGKPYDSIPSLSDRPESPFIAILGYDIKPEATIIYCVLSDTRTGNDHSISPSTRANISNLLYGGFGGSMNNFEPTDIFIVTWNSNDVTVQMILVSQSNYGTSSDRTYALFLYEDIPFEPETILVGFSADDHNYIHPLSSDPSRLHTETNTDIPGVFVYRIDDNEIVEPSQAEVDEVTCTISMHEDGVYMCKCPDGYQQLAENTINCEQEILKCGALENPANGQVVINGQCPGDEAIYTCDDHYKLNGVETRMCMDNGDWSDEEPVCEDIPLTLKFVNNTPYVDETSVEAYIQASRNDVQMLCKIGGDKSIPEENCTSGYYKVMGLKPHYDRKYVLKVKATDSRGEEVVLRSEFRVQGDQQMYYCGVNIINAESGEIPQDGGYFEFRGTGATLNFTCKLNGEESGCGEVTENVTETYWGNRQLERDIHRVNVSNLAPGQRHRFVMNPVTGCGEYRESYRKIGYRFKTF